MTKSNGKISYDFLILTPGLQYNWEKVGGITHDTLGQGNANSIYDFEGAQKTWKVLQEFAKKGGKGAYTDTYTKYRCGGAPKRICSLSEYYARKQGTRDKLQLNYFTASRELYGIPYFTPRLLEIYNERNIPTDLNIRAKGVDISTKRTRSGKIETKGKEKIVTPLVKDCDSLHFTPPMSASDFARDARLDWTESKLAADTWVMADKETLVHKGYQNIASLGDVTDVPTSEISAAIRKQIPVTAKNLIAFIEDKESTEKYNGYTACPIVADYGHALLCEFDYEKKPNVSFPFSMTDTSKEQ